MLALLLKPLLTAILFLGIVFPIAWLLYRVFPNGRLKVMLFRARSGPGATARDKWVMSIAVVAAYAAFFAWIVALSA